MYLLVMRKACVAVLFAFKWLHSFVKALDEIFENMQTNLMPFLGSLEPLNHCFLYVVKTACGTST